MTITKDGNRLTVGRNFVEAVTGTCQSHGTLCLASGRAYTWQAMTPIAEAERALRVAAQQDGQRIVYFESQAIS